MGRAPCCDKNGQKKGPWTPEEDQKLINYIQKHGYGNWRTLPKNAGLQRCGKSCRLRWTNYLRPDIKRGKFSFDEEEAIIHLHSILGNKWSAIAARLPGRTDNEIKNYWNTHIRKKLLRMGIDPVTHAPRMDLLDFSSLVSPLLLSNNSSQIMNFSRLLGFDPPTINPQLLTLATSLLSSSQHQNSNFIPQNVQEKHLNQQFQDIQSFTMTTPLAQFPNEAQATPPNVVQLHSDLADFSSSSSQLSDLASSFTEDYVTASSCDYTNYCRSDQTNGDGPSANSPTFIYYDNNHQNINSSSPKQMNSVISGSNEDEGQIKYCNDILKFGMQAVLDENELM